MVTTKLIEIIAKFRTNAKEFAGVMAMPITQFKKLRDSNDRLDKQLTKNVSTMGKLGLGIRRVTHGFRGFRMELLGVMFFGMGISRFFKGLLTPALNLVGAIDLLRLVLGVMFLDTGLKALDLTMDLLDGWDSLSDTTQRLINKLVVFGFVGGLILSLLGGLGLGIGSVILLFTDLGTAVAATRFLLRRLLGVVAIGFAIHFFLKALDTKTFFDALKSSIGVGLATWIAATLFGLTAGPIAIAAFLLTLSVSLGVQAINEEDWKTALAKMFGSSIIGAAVAKWLLLSAGTPITIPLMFIFTMQAIIRWGKKVSDKWIAENIPKREDMPLPPDIQANLDEMVRVHIGSSDLLISKSDEVKEGISDFQKAPLSAYGNFTDKMIGYNDIILTDFMNINKTMETQSTKLGELTPKLSSYYDELDLSKGILEEIGTTSLSKPVGEMNLLADAAERLNETGIAKEMIKLQEKGLDFSLQMRQLDLAELESKYEFDLEKLRIKKGVDDFIIQGNTVTPINPDDEIIGVKEGGGIASQIVSAISNIFATLDINITAPDGYEATARVTGGSV